MWLGGPLRTHSGATLRPPPTDGMRTTTRARSTRPARQLRTAARQMPVAAGRTLSITMQCATPRGVMNLPPCRARATARVRNTEQEASSRQSVPPNECPTIKPLDPTSRSAESPSECVCAILTKRTGEPPNESELRHSLGRRASSANGIIPIEQEARAQCDRLLPRARG